VKLTIDNLDAAGARDYSVALSAPMRAGEVPLKIERVLNAPSRCTAMLDVNAAGLPVPSRRGRIVVTSDAGTVLFTGYLATEPQRVYAGVATAGPVYRIAINAVSDEWLLDKQPMPLIAASLAESGGRTLATLASRVGSGLLSTTNVAAVATIGVIEPRQTQSWSANAGAIAGAAYSAYRAVNGALSMQPAGSVTHTLSDGDGFFEPAALMTSQVKELANDVTLSGEMEPAAYITELFSGDGTTAAFQLSETPFRLKGTANSSVLLSDSFNTGAFNRSIWQVADSGSHLGFSAAGLSMTGGNGYDGQTTLAAIDPVELGGTILIEAGNVQLGAGSDGVLCGLYDGPTARANCVAGYNVRQSSGNTIVTPFVSGAEVGTSFTLVSGHSYTLRLRVHSVEPQRVLQTYYAMIDGALESFGGGAVNAPLKLVFDVVDLGAASNTPATVLYDGALASSPGACSFVAVNSIQLLGSMGYCRVSQTGSAWVVSTLASGVKQTRLIGVSGEGVDSEISAAGKVTFFSGRVPVAGEFVTVTYRGRRRAVARLEDAASVAAEAAVGFPGAARWLGKVVEPPARSSADCESAAQAVLGLATSRAAALAGAYVAKNPAADIWPGDMLALSLDGTTTNVMVRKVDVEDALAAPEVLTYRITFANDWAEALGIKLSESIAADALLPATAAATPANVLANLQQLQVVSATATALQVDAGLDPPAGGGFEVRRRDWDFGPGVDQDLVLRSPVRNFSIPREAQVEHYYVRMYDAAGTYSRFSSAVLTDLPVS
jgi:hypothetical protein